MLRRTLLALPVLALAACDIPSGIPSWDTTWNVPSRTLTVGVAQVLPSGVSVASDGASFLVAVPSVTVTERLGDDCPECFLVAGRVVPKPAFVVNVSASTALPGDVQSGVVAPGARLEVRVANSNTFDPLRPAAGVFGYMTLVVRNGATVLGRDSVTGAAAALPAGGELARTVTLGGATVSGPVTVDVVLSSPAGDPVLVDPTRTVTITATPSNVRVTQATVTVRGAQVSQSTSADLDVSSSVSDRVQGGRLLIAVKDPFAVRGSLAVRLTTADGASLTKALDVSGGDKSYALDFTRDELRSLLGRPVTITFSGPVSTAGALAITPAQSIAIGTRFELVLSTTNK